MSNETVNKTVTFKSGSNKLLQSFQGVSQEDVEKQIVAMSKSLETKWGGAVEVVGVNVKTSPKV